MTQPSATPTILAVTADDDALLLLVAQGDRPALDELYRRHASVLLQSAWRLLGSTADAEDVVHDLFVGLPDSARRFMPQGNGLGWLCTCTRRLALMRLRSGRRRPAGSLIDTATLTDARTADAAAESALARRLLDRLPLTLREVVLLRVLEDCTHAEIAAELGITEAASQMRLTRGLAALRAMLGGSR